jgi:type III restriction enzyme
MLKSSQSVIAEHTDSEKLRTKENQKIACGRKHFATLGVNYDVVTSLAEVAM